MFSLTNGFVRRLYVKYVQTIAYSRIGLNQNNQSALHRPRILLIDGGTVVAVRFNEAFTVISLAQGEHVYRLLTDAI